MVLEDAQFLGNIPQIFWKISNFLGIFSKYLGKFPICGEYSSKICGGSFHYSFKRFPIFRKYSPNVLENFPFLGNIPQMFRKIPNFGEYSPEICGGSFHNSFGRCPIFRKYSPNILKNFQFYGNIPQKYVAESPSPSIIGENSTF